MDSKGNIKLCTTKLVAKCFAQRKGIDFNETFSAIFSGDYFKTIMSLIAHFKLRILFDGCENNFLNRHFYD